MPPLSLPLLQSGKPSVWEEAIYAFLVGKRGRSGSTRTVESHARMLWPFFRTRTPDQVRAADVLGYALGSAPRGTAATPGPRSPRTEPLLLNAAKGPSPWPPARRGGVGWPRQRAVMGKSDGSTRRSPASHAASHGGLIRSHLVESVDESSAANDRRVPQNDAMHGGPRDL